MAASHHKLNPPHPKHPNLIFVGFKKEQLLFHIFPVKRGMFINGNYIFPQAYITMCTYILTLICTRMGLSERRDRIGRFDPAAVVNYKLGVSITRVGRQQLPDLFERSTTKPKLS
jgi:hypothetical protein